MRFPNLPRSARLAAVLAFALLALPVAQYTAHATEAAVVIPASLMQEPPSGGTSEVATFAGGCFWGVQGVFQHVAGVTSAVSGYAGGAARTANYETVGSGTTRHAEAVQVTFDPSKVSYGKLLQIYFSVAHDPTQRNRQGPDRGTQYRSALFPHGAAQADVAKAYIAQLDAAKVFAAPIATTIEPDETFYPAERYHQDFLTLNPDYPYIVINDLPKVANLKRVFPEEYRADPVLVLNTGK